jgi:addiction module HigA family antidote
MPRVRTHPGEVLKEEFLVPLSMSAHELAEAIGVPANRISDIVRERRSVTADTALRLADQFGTTPQFWLNLQMAHDLSKAEAARDAAPRRMLSAQHDAGYVKSKKADASPKTVARSSLGARNDRRPKSKR